MQKPEIVQKCLTKNKKDSVLAAIFCFAYLKAKDTKYRMLSNRFEFSTHTNYAKTSGKIIDSNVEQRQTFAWPYPLILDRFEVIPI